MVTGASPGGIGSALVEELRDRGYVVFACARTPAKLEALKRDGIEVVELDVTKADTIEAAAKLIADRSQGHLHILINNAGIHPKLTPAIDADLDDVRKVCRARWADADRSDI